MPPEMDLKIKILAKGQQALVVLKRIRGHIGQIGSVASVTGRVTKFAFGTIARVGKIALAPIKLMVGAVGMLAAAFGLLIGKSLNASGNIESLRLQIQGLTSSQEEANKHFTQASQMAIASPFEPQQLVEGKIRLLNIGQTSRRALRIMGDASALTKREIGDLVSMVGSLETEPLRAIGVQLRQESGKFMFEYRDRMQKLHKVTVKGREEAQKELLKIFDVKYGGGMKLFANSLPGLKSTFVGLVKEAAAQFGKGMDPAAKMFLAGVNARLTNLVNSGKLKETGGVVAEKLTNAFSWGQAVFEYAQRVLDNLMQGGSKSLVSGLEISMTAAAEIFATSLMNYLSGMSSIFIGLAKMMSGAFLEDVLQLPFMGKTRLKMATSAANKLSDSEFKSITGQDRATGFERGIRTGSRGQVIKINIDRSAQQMRMLSPEMQAKLAAAERAGTFKSGVQSVASGMGTLTAKNADDVAKIISAAQGRLANEAGSDVPSVGYIKLMQEEGRSQKAAMAEAMKQEMVFFAKRSWENIDGNNLTRRQKTEYRQRLSAPDQYEEGQKLGSGGVVISVQNLHVFSDNVRRMSNAIMLSAGMPGMTPFGV